MADYSTAPGSCLLPAYYAGFVLKRMTNMDKIPATDLEIENLLALYGFRRYKCPDSQDIWTVENSRGQPVIRFDFKQPLWWYMDWLERQCSS